ncbi:MAG TPA: phosphoribosyltransferase family protein [Paludibacteraceae bacterium]|nr:phosphoribosyltransferase family protein [Paludibacteraceae bacterium]HOL00204.1 phosphoribosyltransferase family protein [Paludibacteraceae bacterium]HPC26156.1 phosphoribosyltransferase family protein [Paludibacteraceae bacterium]HPO67242.1 phosphoribosyltransferase family protein [Paludibacteraceae bacterium]HRU63888.1 phosphoribosyltransferase family protein [Paludibacteraceae bacterium]
MTEKSWEEILQRFREIEFQETFDIIVAIANGGIIPAAILNQRLKIEIQLLKINLRDAERKPIYDIPKLLSPINFNYVDKKILLVEDRIKTGATVQFAIELLKDAAQIKTFAVNGKADYSLYNEPCFRFPWQL